MGLGLDQLSLSKSIRLRLGTFSRVTTGGGGGGVDFHYKGIYRCATGMGYTFQASEYINGYHFHFKSISMGYLFHPICIWMGEKSCYDSAHICQIRAEISTHEHWENVFILLFVWLVVMGLRQNYFHISPNFGDFGAKMSFFRYIINQKRKIFIKHWPPPPVFQNTTYIRDVYLYNKQSV